jgi:hypothetical protein
MVPRLLVAVAAIVLLFATTGCSTRVHDVGGDADLGDRLVAGTAVAVVGVTTGPDAGGGFAPDDARDAADALYGALLAGRPDLTVWHPAVAAGLAGADTLASLVAEYGRLGRWRPETVRALAVPLEGCAFLAVGRLTSDRIGSNAMRRDSMNPEARAEGQPEHDSAWAATVNVQRDVQVTLELIDLASGRSVWRADASSRAKQLYQYDASGIGDVTDMQTRLGEADGPVYLSRGGEALKAPDLVDLMRQALTEAAGRLPGGEARP